jgi:hypothetical protein
MGGVSVWHWLVVGLISIPYVWGVIRILRRIGFSGWWVLLALVPYLNLLGLLALAYAKWPVEVGNRWSWLSLKTRYPPVRDLKPPPRRR